MRHDRPVATATSVLLCIPITWVILVVCSLSAVAEPSPTAPLPSPVTPACISSPFGPRVLAVRSRAVTFHNGIDLPAPAGAAVHAIAPGQVLRVQRHGPGGLEMMVQHPGFIGIYSHLGMVAPAIAEGRRVVNGGEKLGVVGHSGVTYGMHLFFGMIVDGRSVDPAPYLGLSRCSTGHRPPADTSTVAARPPSSQAYARVH